MSPTPSTSAASSQECREAQHHACRPGWAGCDCWCHLAPPCLDDSLIQMTPEAEALGDYLRESARSDEGTRP